MPQGQEQQMFAYGGYKDPNNPPSTLMKKPTPQLQGNSNTLTLPQMPIASSEDIQNADWDRGVAAAREQVAYNTQPCILS